MRSTDRGRMRVWISAAAAAAFIGTVIYLAWFSPWAQLPAQIPVSVSIPR